ncbi:MULTISPECIES: hypothetical protein [unclassified Sphingopyxis]|uniref:hypothetical protein n=1 Tax=unclassified Sphingopyxis TaxID=2614943 RepID=UPI0007368CC4|nr:MULTISPECIES: hypothetical protein [unclassified Sphingopyxis]KTE34624.1 hypothetical protein ATE62_15940 [Sphingopyxis sp. HIX]KTE80189.1 hypothetical protein ATE72_18140 [Sphingopyxis sp. HXXIV]
MTASSRIRLTIDKLTLVGVAPGDAAAVRRALAVALESRLAGTDAALLAGDHPRLSLMIAPGQGPAALGHAAGQAIGARLTGGGR